MIRLTADNNHLYDKTDLGNVVYIGRKRKLWMQQTCKHRTKKTGFQGFAHIDFKSLPAKFPPTKAQRKARKLVFADINI